MAFAKPIKIYMKTLDHAERALEIADQILDLSTDLKLIMLERKREEDAKSPRDRLTLLGGGSAADRPAELSEALEGEAQVIALQPKD